MIAFLLKASVAALKQFPDFNASLDRSRENLILKKYFNIGVAVGYAGGAGRAGDPRCGPQGRLRARKGVGRLQREARARKLTPTDMSGGCFTISSLGGIGGTGFTPIVNAPRWRSSASAVRARCRCGVTERSSRLILPLSLLRPPGDRRGGGARFASYLSFVLGTCGGSCCDGSSASSTPAG